VIRHLNGHDLVSVVDFLNTVFDKTYDFYITNNRERKFLKNNWKLTEKILKYQEIICIENKVIDGLMLIYRSKGFRPYAKLLAKTEKDYEGLIKFLTWNYKEEIFLKVKKNNILIKILFTKIFEKGIMKYIPKSNFIVIGDRGSEILLKKEKGVKYEFTNKY
jgi:hypothetical protein